MANPAACLERFAPLVPTLSDLAFVIPLLVLFWSTTGVGWLLTDSDTGWHIRTGDWILSNNRIPKADIFSFTMAGRPWVAWEWLSDVAMALAHRWGGLGGVAWLAILLLGATSVFVYREAARECGHRFISIALTWLSMSASTIHWLARPHLATALMAAIFCRILSRVERERNPAMLLSLPLLTILWTNLHGGFFVGIALISTYGIGAAAEESLHGSRKSAWLRSQKYIFAALGCMLASLLNPCGYRLHVHVAQYLGTTFCFARISEFQSIDFHAFTAPYFETLLILAIAAAAWHVRSGRLIHALLLVSWSHLALFSVRNIPIFAVVAAPGIGLALREWLERGTVFRLLKENIARFESDLQSIAERCQGRRWHLAPCFVALVLALLLAHHGQQRVFQAAFDESRFPVNAAQFLSQEQQLSSMRLYSSWQWGGYLIYRLWPALKVFHDGRTDFYGPAFVEEGLLAWNASPDWCQILERYRVNAALLPIDSALATVLRGRSDWKPEYQDRIAVLFVKVKPEK